MASELDEVLEDRQIFQRDMRAFRKSMFRYMALFWFLIPYILFAPAWNAVINNPHEKGEWIGFAILSVLIVPFWISAGWVGKRLYDALDDLDEQSDEIEDAKAAKRKILLVRADRIERAERRLARLNSEAEAAERQKIAEDLDRLRNELNDPE